MKNTPTDRLKKSRISGGVLTLLAAAVIAPAPLARGSIVVYETISQTVGSTSNLTGSGDADNTTGWTAGVVGEFVMLNTATSQYAGLRVSVLDPTGTLHPGTDSLMVAQTTNSQGLTDPGTLSIYFRPTGTDTEPGAGSVSGAWSARILFESFALAGSPGSFSLTSTPAPVNVSLTSLDIDHNQKYYVQTVGFTHETYSPTSLTPAPAIAGYTGFTSSADSAFNDPSTAVTSRSTGAIDQFEAVVGHNSVALFMFEFRNNSAIVPEPSTSLLALAGIGGFLARRRR